MENSTPSEIENRIKAGWTFYYKYKEILKDKKIPMSLRSKIINVCLIPIMTYGCETWAMNKETEHKLGVTQRKIERLLL